MPFRLRGLVIALVTLVASLGASGAAPAQAPGPDQIGQWDAPVEVGLSGIHAALLPDGRVLLYDKIHVDGMGAAAVTFDPVTGATTDVTVPYLHNVFCGGLSFLPDGRLLATGGERSLEPGAEVGEGTSQVSTFDWRTGAWAEQEPMANARWYPTNVSMPDGTTLVFSGRDVRGATIAAVESHDPDTGGWTTLPPSADQETNGLYPRMFLLADGRVLLAGPTPETRAFDPATATWTNVGRTLDGRREAGGAVLLPGLTAVLAAGGSARLSAELLDMSAPTPAWRYTGSLNRMRNHTNLVLLPDGKVLAVGGGENPISGAPALEPELYDPATETWSLMAPQQVERQYHSTALLLPDGRVLSAGDEEVPGEHTVEIYSPPYLFRGPRPRLNRVPSSISYGERFRVRSRQAATIERVALIRPGATTHGFDQSQRYVDVPFALVGDRLVVDAPPNATIAPPGYYLLFLVNGNGVPSVGRFVHLS